MKIADELNRWIDHFKSQWFKTFLETGRINWNEYDLIKNTNTIKSSGIDIKKSKIFVNFIIRCI